MASIGRVWDGFDFSLVEVVLELPAIFEDILIILIALGGSDCVNDRVVRIGLQVE